MPISILEAMAFATPIVASEVHGINEAVEDEVSGLLFNPSSEEDLAEKLNRLLEDEAFARSIGDKGRQRSLVMFSAERMAAEYVAMYESARISRSIGKYTLSGSEAGQTGVPAQ